MEINLGYVHMESYTNKSPLFPDYWTNPEDNDAESIKESQKEIDSCPENEVILEPNNTYELKITYPVKNPYITEIKTLDKGLTRREVVSLIVKHYKKMYKEEDKSTKIKPGHVPNMYNRNETNGKYGIWGHCLGDLILHTLTKDGNKLGVHCDS